MWFLGVIHLKHKQKIHLIFDLAKYFFFLNHIFCQNKKASVADHLNVYTFALRILHLKPAELHRNIVIIIIFEILIFFYLCKKLSHTHTHFIKNSTKFSWTITGHLNLDYEFLCIQTACLILRCQRHLAWSLSHLVSESFSFWAIW